MANKLKGAPVDKKEEEGKKPKTVKPEAGKQAKPGAESAVAFKKEKEEDLNLRKLARDERTWKIIGTLSLLISIFLFIAFVSYFFTWKEDQSNVINNGSSFLWDDEARASNLLGRLGAYTADFFIWKGFGVAAFLFCTFFFVVGINLLFNRRVFSIWRNLKYVTFGLLIASVTTAFVLSGAEFLYGGLVGQMISNWLSNFLGTVGTAALLLVVGVSYLIWQFNPTFKLPESKTPVLDDVDDEEENNNASPSENELKNGSSLNERYAEKGNTLKGEGAMLQNTHDSASDIGLTIIEKEEDEPFEVEAPAEKELVDDIMHRNELELPEEEPETISSPRKKDTLPLTDLPLEIKIAEKEPEDEMREKGYGDLPPYEPTLDLRDYKYPTINLLETHGSEKIVQDPGELEANKNQIINTLKNYDINIQKISATVGPTVTLYEIVPAAGVRISRIKNLEDDIALSLAALGIRIIAPIPGKGTIGIEVPNHKKSIVSMKTLLASEKFTHSTG